jgi:serine/threonine-protein kinase HipA
MKLLVRYENHLVGQLDEEFNFSYEESWKSSSSAFDIAFSLPRIGQFQKADVLAVFSNMLIEGDLRSFIAKIEKIDVNDHFTFLKEFGEDCAGALVISENVTSKSKPAEKLSWSELDKRIDERSPLVAMGDGHFSLAGAQDKMAIVLNGEDIFLPNTTVPSTHILKPVSSWEGVRETVFNEWFCMRLAKEVGLSVPNVDIFHSKHAYYLVDRYDRKDGLRLHQQDICQALSLMAPKKYENRGGPGIARIYELIQDESQNKFNDLRQFLRWVLFNILIGNNDSHAKNVSFLFSDGKWSLAPAYDLMSTAVYENFTKNFAFSIGGQFRAVDWRRRHFEMLESELNVKTGSLSSMMETMIEDVVLALPQVEYEGKQLFPDAFMGKKIVEYIQKMIGVLDQKVLSQASRKNG